MAMKSPFFILFVLSFSLYIFTNVQATKSNELLIKRECQGVTDFTDRVKLASSLVGCVDNQLVSLDDHITKLKTKLAPVTGLFKAYWACGKTLVASKAFLTTAKKKLGAGDYIGAKVAVWAAYKSTAVCHVAFATWYGKTHPVVEQKVSVVEELCEATASAIESLQGV